MTCKYGIHMNGGGRNTYPDSAAVSQEGAPGAPRQRIWADDERLSDLAWTSSSLQASSGV
ncbi:hypothetical protein HID58_046204 [Brassica napus]|uniref:Uncharacterized protein n=1 Tax=Brassica napus TaxID=3708 RepID=A0ABQ8AVT2_BRANA|nr:hypothetical protein HID58_046204 [Brassica napus]